MVKLNRRREFFVAILSGVTGFGVLLLSWLIFMRIVLGHFFGGAMSLWENLVILCVVPLLIAIGAAIPAWTLGATIQHSLISGIISMTVFVLVDVTGARTNYAPFVEYETVAFILAAFVTVVIAISQQNDLSSARLNIIFWSAIALIGLRFILPGNDIAVGISISFLAWVTLPLVATIFKRTDENE